MSLLFTSVPFFCVSDLFCFASFPLFSFVVRVRVAQHKGRYVVKSGSDFRQFSRLDLLLERTSAEAGLSQRRRSRGPISPLPGTQNAVFDWPLDPRQRVSVDESICGMTMSATLEELFGDFCYSSDACLDVGYRVIRDQRSTASAAATSVASGSRAGRPTAAAAAGGTANGTNSTATATAPAPRSAHSAPLQRGRTIELEAVAESSTNNGGEHSSNSNRSISPSTPTPTSASASTSTSMELRNNNTSEDAVFDEVVLRRKTAARIAPTEPIARAAADETDMDTGAGFRRNFEYMDMAQLPRHAAYSTKILSITIKEITVDSSWTEDPEMKAIVEKYTSMTHLCINLLCTFGRKFGMTCDFVYSQCRDYCR